MCKNILLWVCSVFCITYTYLQLIQLDRLLEVQKVYNLIKTLINDGNTYYIDLAVVDRKEGKCVSQLFVQIIAKCFRLGFGRKPVFILYKRRHLTLTNLYNIRNQ